MHPAVFTVFTVLQQQLQPNTAAALRTAVPDLEEEDLDAMMRAPMRSFEPNQIQVHAP
jgi:hypothetical protein